MSKVSSAPRILVQNVICALALLLTTAGCAASPSGTQNQAQATATPTLIPIPPTQTPVTLQIHTLSMGGFKAQLAIPGGPDGLLLYPAVQPNFAGLPYISFYRFNNQQITQIATAPTEPDGSLGGIIAGNYSGDWVSYVADGANKANWVFWAYNVKTDQRIQVDTVTHSRGGWVGSVASPTDLVWSLLTLNSSGGAGSELLDYTYATGQTRTLLTSESAIFKPLAMNGNAILLVETDANSGANTTWIEKLDQTAPSKIADGGGVNGWISSRYAVWDDPHSGGTSLYDLSIGKLNPNFANCLRPAIADPQPYMVCVQFNADSWVLVHVPDGAETLFDSGQASLGDGGEIYNGRAFFIGPHGDVQYFDLPAQ
jgi:hypothetical protein